jgi:putative transposase
LPLILPEFEERIYAAIAAKCSEPNCKVLAIGGIEDHIHLLVRLPTTLSVAQLVGEVKGVSSHLVTHEMRPGVFFKWQGAYGAFTLHKSIVDGVATYVRNQKAHHRDNQLVAEWERCESLD